MRVVSFPHGGVVFGWLFSGWRLSVRCLSRYWKSRGEREYDVVVVVCEWVCSCSARVTLHDRMVCSSGLWEWGMNRDKPCAGVTNLEIEFVRDNQTAHSRQFSVTVPAVWRAVSLDHGSESSRGCLSLGYLPPKSIHS